MLLRRHRAATHIAATLSAPRASPLHLLRYYLSRPGARRTLAKTVSFGGASLIGLRLSTPVRIEREASSMAVEQEEEEGRGRGQRAVLASQREGAEAREGRVARGGGGAHRALWPPPGGGGGRGVGRVARWFPLSAREGFSQWVSCGIPGRVRWNTC